MRESRTRSHRLTVAVCTAAALLLALLSPVAAEAQAEPGQALAVINELHYHPEDPWGDAEFVELHNPGDTDADLTGVCWTDGISGCFPDGVMLPAGGFVVATKDADLYAQRFPDAPAPAMEFGGSLSNSGERVTLTAADGATVLSSVEYADRGDWPTEPDGNGPSLELTDPLAPIDDPTLWFASDGEPTPGAVNTRFGFTPVVDATVVINELHYHPEDPWGDAEFVELHNPGDTDQDLSGACWTEGIKDCFPDGVMLPAGGFVVATKDADLYAQRFPDAPAPAMEFGGSLSNSGERVTLTAADGATVLSSVEYADRGDWPAEPDGNGPSLELIDPWSDIDTPLAWLPSLGEPTPGAVNTRFGTGTRAELSDLRIGSVAAGQPVPVSVDATEGTVELEVTVWFEDPIRIPLTLESGTTHVGEIPAQPAGTLVRYRALATTTAGTTHLPIEGAAMPTLGYVVERPPADPPTNLPLVDWYIDPVDHEYLYDNYRTNDYVPAVVAVDGRVWDGAEVRVQGNSRSKDKFSYKFKMPRGEPFEASFLDHPVDEFVFDDDRGDQSGTVATISGILYQATNEYIQQMAKIRVHRNHEDWGMFTFTEEYDGLWRERMGLDGGGALHYEPLDITGVFHDDGDVAAVANRFKKRYPKDDDFGPLHDLLSVIDQPPTPENVAAVHDEFDMPALVEALAVGAIVQHWDSTVHNYQIVRRRDGRWLFVPDDYDNTMPNHEFWRVPAFFPYGPDGLLNSLRNDPTFNEMYRRRFRTLADTHLGSGALAALVDEHAALVRDDQDSDLERWPRANTISAEAGRQRLQNYVAYRTRDLLVDHRNDRELPAAPTAGLPVDIVSARTTGSGATHEIVLENPHDDESIDLSGWTLEGAGTATLPPGTVIVAGGRIHVPVDDAASADLREPGSIVAGTLDDALPASGEVRIVDTGGTVRGRADVGAVADDPAAPTGPDIVVEAFADQSETLSPNGLGVGLTVAVRNNRSTPITGVRLRGVGTDCGRDLGTIAAGGSTVIRCSVGEGDDRDRTQLLQVTVGGRVYRSARVQVRQLVHSTGYFSQYLADAPHIGVVALADENRIALPFTPAEPPVRPTRNTPPDRWTILLGREPGRAIPTVGRRHAPEGDIVDEFAEGVPLQLTLATRNGAGTGTPTAPTPFLTPRPSTLWPHENVDDFITAAFDEGRGTAPSADERQLTRDLLDAGGSPAALIEDLISDRPWTGNAAAVIRLYRAFFERTPDTEGLEHWLGRRADGWTLAKIATFFARSAEFRTRSGGLGDTAFVTFVYESVLGRSPDPAGLLHWVVALRSGRSRGSVMTQFSESPEAKRKLEPWVQPTAIHWFLLDRAPSTAEALPAIEWLEGGGSLQTVIDGVRSSDEYGARHD